MKHLEGGSYQQRGDDGKAELVERAGKPADKHVASPQLKAELKAAAATAEASEGAAPTETAPDSESADAAASTARKRRASTTQE